MKNIIGLIIILVAKIQKPSYGSYFDPPEYGECDFILFEITLHDLYNSKGKKLPNCKEKLQKLLEDKIGKNL